MGIRASIRWLRKVLFRPPRLSDVRVKPATEHSTRPVFSMMNLPEADEDTRPLERTFMSWADAQSTLPHGLEMSEEELAELPDELRDVYSSHAARDDARAPHQSA
jgi:hypothetical protein